ncbi:hypothetical protein D3C85_1937990 [compost metagenome]
MVQQRQRLTQETAQIGGHAGNNLPLLYRGKEVVELTFELRKARVLQQIAFVLKLGLERRPGVDL